MKESLHYFAASIDFWGNQACPSHSAIQPVVYVEAQVPALLNHINRVSTGSGAVLFLSEVKHHLSGLVHILKQVIAPRPLHKLWGETSKNINIPKDKWSFMNLDAYRTNTLQFIKMLTVSDFLFFKLKFLAVITPTVNFFVCPTAAKVLWWLTILKLSGINSRMTFNEHLSAPWKPLERIRNRGKAPSNGSSKYYNKRCGLINNTCRDIIWKLLYETRLI